MSDDARLLAALQLVDGELPAKHPPLEEWSVADHVHHRQTGEEPLSPEFVAYAKRAAKAAGIPAHELGLPDDRPLEELGVEGHLQRIRRVRD